MHYWICTVRISQRSYGQGNHVYGSACETYGTNLDEFVEFHYTACVKCKATTVYQESAILIDSGGSEIYDIYGYDE